MEYWDYRAGVRKERGRKRSLRARGWDYSSEGIYFLTVVVRNRKPIFGEIVEGGVLLNDFGRIVDETWCELPVRYPGLRLDEYVIMPDHFHGIVYNPRVPTAVVGAGHDPPLQSNSAGRVCKLEMDIPKVVGYFKMNSAKRINTLRQTPGIPVWQRSFHDRIIRNEAELAARRLYIRKNPENTA